jgi:DNA-binding protein HU-beta
MNKAEFVSYIADKNNCTKAEAERSLDMISDSITRALSEGNKINLVGFGAFDTVHTPAREGRNPRTGDKINIKAYNQVKFRAGQKLKDACNS